MIYLIMENRWSFNLAIAKRMQNSKKLRARKNEGFTAYQKQENHFAFLDMIQGNLQHFYCRGTKICFMVSYTNFILDFTFSFKILKLKYYLF